MSRSFSPFCCTTLACQLRQGVGLLFFPSQLCGGARICSYGSGPDWREREVFLSSVSFVGKWSGFDSESAPVPIPRHTARDTLLRLAKIIDPHDRRAGLLRPTRDAVRARDAHGSPFTVLVVAVLAGAALRAIRMELGVLIQWDRKGGMRVAEDVPAVPAVVAPLEEGEGGLANGCVADQRVGVRLPVLA